MRGAGLRIARRALQVQPVIVYEPYYSHRHLQGGRRVMATSHSSSMVATTSAGCRGRMGT